MILISDSIALSKLLSKPTTCTLILFDFVVLTLKTAIFCLFSLSIKLKIFQILIVGAGPAGYFATQAFQNRETEGLNFKIDLVEKLPTPWGLVRSGVAPDHQKIKSISKIFEKIVVEGSVQIHVWESNLFRNGIRDYNSRISNIQNYDVIITVPSQAPLNQMIINEFKSYINPNKTLMIDDFLLKNRVKDIRWDNEEYKEVEEREGKNPEQIAKVRKMRDITLRSLYSKINMDKEFQIKMVTKSSLRRYFYKFMHINDKLDEEIFLKVNNGKILIIDDSFGSGVTMREAARSIKHLNPKRIDAFILLHDYAPSSKKTS